MHIKYFWYALLDFWTHNFQATFISTFVVHLHWKFTMWLKICWEITVWSFVEFCWAVLKLCPTKSCAIFFAPPDIYRYNEYGCMVRYLLKWHSWRGQHTCRQQMEWETKKKHYCHSLIYLHVVDANVLVTEPVVLAIYGKLWWKGSLLFTTASSQK